MDTGNPVPDWADSQLSGQLPVLRARGEGQDLEYMTAFPKNAWDLAKEIAAFATSNSGRILIGISDKGELIGVPGTETSKGRDDILNRCGGLCRGTVKPAITPGAKFAVESGKVVLVLTISKGREPIYYCANVPYVRHVAESRPAEPHEVVSLILEHARSPEVSEAQERARELTDFYTGLAGWFVRFLICADEVDERDTNPWFDRWRGDIGYAAGRLRELGARDIAHAEGIGSELIDLAQRLDEIATAHPSLMPNVEAEAKAAAEIVRELKRRLIDSKRVDADDLKFSSETIRATARKLNDLANRSSKMMDNGRIEEVQTEASAHGYTLLQLAYHNIESLLPGLQEGLKKIGRELHLIETRTIYIDGGASMDAIEATISDCSTRLSDLVSKLPHDKKE